MTDVFLLILNMSINASLVICLVILLRAASCKAPKWLRCGLWVLVAFRLLCPFAIKSSFSIIPDSTDWLQVNSAKDHITETSDIGIAVSDSIKTDDYKNTVGNTDENSYDEPRVSGIAGLKILDTDYNSNVINDNGTVFVKNVSRSDKNDAADNAGGKEQSETADLETVVSDNPGNMAEGYAGTATVIWLGGFCLMTAYCVFSLLKLRKRLKGAIPIGLMNEPDIAAGTHTDTYVSDDIKSPFVFGIIRPKIYLPSGLDERTTGYVLAHEQNHIRRGDNIWKALGLLLLAVHWFNPLVWIAYYLFARDVEAACDEAVISGKTREEIKGYAIALLKCSIANNNPLLCTLSFGEVSVKKRIRDISEYRQPKLKVIVSVILIGALVSACTLTDPVTEKQAPEQTELTGNEDITVGETSHADMIGNTDSTDRITAYTGMTEGMDDADPMSAGAGTDDQVSKTTAGNVSWKPGVGDDGSTCDIRISANNEIGYILNGQFVLDESLCKNREDVKPENMNFDGSVRRIADDDLYITVIDDKGMVHSTFPYDSVAVREQQKTAYRDVKNIFQGLEDRRPDPLITIDLEAMKDVAYLKCRYSYSYIEVDEAGRVFKDGERIYTDEIKAVQVAESYTNGMIFVLLENGRVITPDYNPVKTFLETSEDYRAWRCVTEIHSDGAHIIGLCADGSVLCVQKSLQWRISDWKNIRHMALNSGNIVGVDSDGHVRYQPVSLNYVNSATLTNENGIVEEHLKLDEIREELATWENVLDVDCNDQYIVGLTADGIKILYLYRTAA